MNISNPKTTIGGLPLATTWYVNTRFEGTKKYIDAVSAFLSGYTDQEVTAATNAAIERQEALSAQSDVNDGQVIQAFCRYITGNTSENVPSVFVNNYITDFLRPREYGYAYLGPDKKIADELMPDISLMEITVVDVKQIFNTLSGKTLLNSTNAEGFYNEALSAGQDVAKVVTLVKKMLQKYVLIQQVESPEQMKVFSSGDIIVITYYDDVNKSFARSFDDPSRSAFKNVFSQSFIAGGWICNKETRDENNNQLNTSVTFTKLSFNQGEVISVNNLIPTANGNVAINLSKVLLLNEENKDGAYIGETLAKDIQQIRSLASDPTAINTVPTAEGLVQPLDFNQRFVYNDRINNAGYSYTTLNEFATLNIKAKEVTDFISAALDTERARAIADEQTISAALDAEVVRSTDYDNYLSGVIGVEAALSGATVTTALTALKKHTEITCNTAEANFNKLADEINTEDYDVLDVYTIVIPAGKVKDIDLASQGITISAAQYTAAHVIDGYTTLYESNVYNYFGFAPTFVGADISEVTFAGFNGRILDIYAFDTDTNKYVKIDADIHYKEVTYDNDIKDVVAEFILLGEYNLAAGENASFTNIDKLVVRYTRKHTYNPAAFEVNQLFQ